MLVAFDALRLCCTSFPATIAPVVSMRFSPFMTFLLYSKLSRPSTQPGWAFELFIVSWLLVVSCRYGVAKSGGGESALFIVPLFCLALSVMYMQCAVGIKLWTVYEYFNLNSKRRQLTLLGYAIEFETWRSFLLLRRSHKFHLLLDSSKRWR